MGQAAAVIKARSLKRADEVEGRDEEPKILLVFNDTSGIAAVEGRDTFAYLSYADLGSILRKVRVKPMLDKLGAEEAGKLIGKLGDLLSYLEGEV